MAVDNIFSSVAYSFFFLFFLFFFSLDTNTYKDSRKDQKTDKQTQTKGGEYKQPSNKSVVADRGN